MRTVTIAGITALFPDQLSSVFRYDLFIELQATKPDYTIDNIEIQGVIYTAPWFNNKCRFYYDIDLSTADGAYITYNVTYKGSTLSQTNYLAILPPEEFDMKCPGLINFISSTGFTMELPFNVTRVSYGSDAGDNVYTHVKTPQNNEFTYSKRINQPKITYTCVAQVKPYDLDSESYALLSVGTTPFATVQGFHVTATITGTNTVVVKDDSKVMDITFTIVIDNQSYNLKNVRQW